METHIHIHHHYHGLEKLEQLIRIINQKQNKIMGELEDISAQLDRIDHAHDEIKKDLDFIKATLPATGGLDAAATKLIKARVTAIADKLDALDSETDSNPTPPVE